MNYEKQIDKSLYEFSKYMSKERWCSLWHQLVEIQKLNPRRVLENAPGPGLFKILGGRSGINVETLDFDPDLEPDHVGTVTALPFENATYDVVCAFQMLEHLPYDDSLVAFQEMVRVSGGHVVISLPDAQAVWRYRIHIPRFGIHDFLIPRPKLSLPVHSFDGEHYWELNKRGYSLKRVISDFSKFSCLVETYRVIENPSHRFFIFEC